MKRNVGKTYYYPNFITDAERDVLKDWALRNESRLVPNPTGPFRARNLFESIPEKLELLKDIKNRIIEVEELSDKSFEPFRGDFVSIQRNGAKVPNHTDHNPVNPALYSIRYNLFISLPEKGGLPIYDGEILNVLEKCLLKVESGLIPHSTTEIIGEIPRIILSYGFAIKKY
jgi:hypothetical protein